MTAGSTSAALLDRTMMQRALDLAARGRYTTAPNPRVGCVLAHGAEVVGEGFHRCAGGAHAESFALAQAGARAQGATAYVTLEPCAHHGRTPPCCEALIAAGVGRVVAAIADPDPRVAGRGFEALRAAGITVEVGCEHDAARELNRGFFSRIECGRPWLRLKMAMSLDGRTALADGRSQWITGPQARADNMRWRAASDAILTGIGTVLADDPALTVRLEPDVDFVAPLRVILDTRLRIPATARVLDDAAPSLVVAEPESIASRRDLPPTKLLSCPHHSTGLGLAVVLAELAARGIGEVQVEAGPRLAGALVAAELVDEVLLYVNPSFLGDTALPLLRLTPLASLDERSRWRLLEAQTLGEDLRLRLRPA